MIARWAFLARVPLQVILNGVICRPRCMGKPTLGGS